VFHPLAKLERQTYNKTLKRFKGIQSKLFLACEIREKRRGKFVGVTVSISGVLSVLFKVLYHGNLDILLLDELYKLQIGRTKA